MANRESKSPRVFISYSHDDEQHRAWVLRLATDLRVGGVDAVLDQWDLRLGQDIAHFMEQGIAEADRVILVCSEPYVEKAHEGAGGVGYEKMIVTRDIVASIATNKFLPLIRRNHRKTMPAFLGTRLHVDFDDDTKYSERLEDLLREIHGAPRLPKPALGSNPLSMRATPAVENPPSGSARNVFGDPWFARLRDEALPKVLKFGQATMEVAFGAVQPSVNVDQATLLDAAERSAIHTFGWPIGVVLHVQDGRPKPRTDGIVAEIVSPGLSTHYELDYWALRRNGDFYLVQNLFEDTRDPGAIFFNTRIIRVAETILYCRNLYANLGYPDGSGVDLRVRHTGLKGRRLSAAGNRFMGPVPRFATAEAVEETVSLVHPVSDDSVARLTKSLLDPLFVVFDFFTVDDRIYDEIVKSFIQGKAT
jgi:hypothetical protein